MYIRILGIALFFVFSGAALVAADSPVDGRAGRAEVRFLEGMIDHHQMALDMANDCLNQSTTDAIQSLCEAVIEAQQPEIAQMQAWLLNWYNISYQPVSMILETTGEDMLGMDHSQHAMTEEATFTDPPMTMGMMAGLSRLSGVEYEIAWLESMIDHHDDAIHMAHRILEQAQHPELIALANAIITDQSTEIEHMETLITELSNV